MSRKHLLLLVILVFVCAVAARAQSASAVFTGPQNMDAGLQSGLNNLTGYVAVLLPGNKRFKIKDIAEEGSLNPLR